MVHPVDIVAVFHYRFWSWMGFQFVQTDVLSTGDDIFTQLDMAPDSETFMLGDMYLRPHTTNLFAFQGERLFTFGPVYRRDDDHSHLPRFHQCDVLMNQGLFEGIEKVLNSIRGIYSLMERDFPRFRIRPHFFPYTSPSFEIDLLIEGKWIEVSGCGVMKDGRFACGMGLERLWCGLSGVPMRLLSG